MAKTANAWHTLPYRQQEADRAVREEISKTYLKVSNKNNKKFLPRLPWIITILALSLSLSLFILRSNIDIKIRILGEVPSIRGGRPVEDEFERAPDKGIFLVKGSTDNKDIVKNVYFAGDAVIFSKVAKDQVILGNSRGSGWANYTLELREPADFSRFDLRYMARGSRGGEYLIFVIVDSGSRSYRIEPETTGRLTNDWRRYVMNFRQAENAVDLTEITTIKFEFGNLTAGNNPLTTIYLKDVYVAKTKRLKWL